jgi:hypothetical protein
MLLAAAVTVVALAVWLTHLPNAVRGLDNRAAHNAQQTPVDRELEVARYVGISSDFVLAAKRIVPPGATFEVVTGEAAHPRTPLVLSALPAYMQNLLLPRLEEQSGAPWVLCYGCDPSGTHARRVAWRRGPLAILGP